jgi:hypothetical protein
LKNRKNPSNERGEEEEEERERESIIYNNIGGGYIHICA